MSRSKRRLLVTMAILAVTVPVGIEVGQAPNEPDWEKAAGGKMEFEVASVRLNPGPFEPSNFRLSPDDAYASTGGLLNADFFRSQLTLNLPTRSSQRVNSLRQGMRSCRSGSRWIIMTFMRGQQNKIPLKTRCSLMRLNAAYDAGSAKRAVWIRKDRRS